MGGRAAAEVGGTLDSRSSVARARGREREKEKVIASHYRSQFALCTLPAGTQPPLQRCYNCCVLLFFLYQGQGGDNMSL